MTKQSNKRLKERHAKRDDVLEMGGFIWRRDDKIRSESMKN